MILDERTEFCDDQTLNTGAAGTYNIGDTIDLGLAGRDIGSPGQHLSVVISVGTTGIGVASGTGTVAFQLVSDDTPTIATNGTQSVHAVTRAFATSTTSATTTLKPGTVLAQFELPSPANGQPFERYVGIQQVTGTTAISGGRVDVFLTPSPATWKAYDAPWQP